MTTVAHSDPLSRCDCAAAAGGRLEELEKVPADHNPGRTPEGHPSHTKTGTAEIAAASAAARAQIDQLAATARDIPARAPLGDSHPHRLFAAEAVARRRSARRPWVPVASSVGVALVVLFAVIPHPTVRIWTDLTRQSATGEYGAFELTRGERNFYIGSDVISSAAQDAIDELDRRALPGDRLFVGPADLRITPYSDAYLYYLFPELVPATRYIEMDPGVANAEGSGLAEGVASADWLILSHVWDPWDEPNDSRESGSDAPNRVVAEQFCAVDEFGPRRRRRSCCTSDAGSRPARHLGAGEGPAVVSSLMRAVVIVPIYQEVDNIEGFLRAVHAAAPDAGILVVDDASPDGRSSPPCWPSWKPGAKWRSAHATSSGAARPIGRSTAEGCRATATATPVGCWGSRSATPPPASGLPAVGARGHLV